MSELSEIYEQAHALKGRTDSKKIIQTTVDQLARCGATHTLITGLPMPNRALMGLVLHLDWPDVRFEGEFISSISNQDYIIGTCFSTFQPFILQANKEDMAHSDLVATSIGERDTIPFAIIPVEDIEPLQAAVIFTGNNLVASNERLSALSVLIKHAFQELLHIGLISRDRPGDLSDRERSVLQLTAIGHTASDIAFLLKISQRTVHAHLQNAGLKLNATNKTHTVVEALRYAQIKL